MEEDGGEIYRLPEGCISNVLSLTTPRDSCRSALVSTTFRSAAESDTVWERFLPPDYPEILSRAVAPVEFLSKRELYFRLCDSVLINGGKMSFALEKSSGAKCYTLSARELVIVWGDTSDYWRWISLSDSRFSEVAELLNVCWLEIRGRIDSKILTPKTTYAAYLLFKIICGSHGLGLHEQEASVKVGAHVSEHTVCLKRDENEARLRLHQHAVMRVRNWRGLQTFRRVEERINGSVRGPRAREDGWMEMELGEFSNYEEGNGEVEISFLEVKGGNWKRGLVIEGIEVRPKK